MGKFQIMKGAERRPMGNILTGRSGIGKTYLLSTLPGVLFLPTERGFTGVSPDHADGLMRLKKPESLVELYEMLKQVRQDAKSLGVRHFVMDSYSGTQKLINKHVCKLESVAHMDAKEYKTLFTAARVHDSKLQDEFDLLRDDCGVHVWIVFHAADVNESTDQGDTYQRSDLAAEGTGQSLIQLRNLWRTWAENVWFIDWDAKVQAGSKMGKKAIGKFNARILRTRETPQHYAKSRYSLPTTLPASWPDIARALSANITASDDKLRSQIDAQLGQLSETNRGLIDADLKNAKTNSALAAILSRVGGMISAAEDAEEDLPGRDVEPETEAAPNFMPEEETEPQNDGPNTDFIELGTRIERADAKSDIDAAMKEVTASFKAGRITTDEGKKLGAMASAKVKAFRAEALAAEQALAAKETGEQSEAAA